MEKKITENSYGCKKKDIVCHFVYHLGRNIDVMEQTEESAQTIFGSREYQQ